MAIEHYDVFVIGTGTAGKGVAKDCAAAGMKVAVADNREYGGTCPNRGCDPKKVLVGATEIVQLAQNLKGKGITEVPKIDWQELQKFKENFTSAIPISTEKDFKKAGITMYHQSPKFLDETTLSVEGKTITAGKIVITSGMHPRELKIDGREHLLKSEDFLNQPTLPEEIIFIGGGYVGMEFAHIAARCGSKVTVIEMSERPLMPFDEDMVSHITKASEVLGINFIFNAKVTEVELLQTNYRVSFQKNGKTETVKAKAVFNTSGRVPSIEDLDLEKGNIAFERDGISVNTFLQSTTNKNVYACGDVSASGTLPLTPISSLETKIVSENIRNGNTTKLTYPVTPSIVYTLPQIATVGMGEKEAKGKGHDIIVEYKSVPKWFNAKRINEKTYAYKTIIDKNTDVILGAHIVAAHCDEIINLFTMAITMKMKATDLKSIIFAYPTWGNDIRGMV
ncbi:MAG: dihydrolipoyl dehydrogenase family protein [Patiriisocius sp.]|uniref:dihydrolipoyl dehydrogenase family protein n=1 Tax=Patiriisocius sp. TaxID=2822396 RepID=UPI003EFAE879